MVFKIHWSTYIGLFGIMMVNIPLIVSILAPMLASASSNKGQLPMERIDGHDWYTLFQPSSSNISKRSNTPNNYSGGDEEVDLHKGEFCVDVSTYGPPKYEKKPVKVCDSEFVKNCNDRSEQVIIVCL